MPCFSTCLNYFEISNQQATKYAQNLRLHFLEFNCHCNFSTLNFSFFTCSLKKYFFKISYHTKLSLARHHGCVACKSVHLLHHFTDDCDHEKCFQFSQHCSGAPLTTDTWSQVSGQCWCITYHTLTAGIMSKPTVVHYSLCLSLPGKILKILTMICTFWHLLYPYEM